VTRLALLLAVLGCGKGERSVAVDDAAVEVVVVAPVPPDAGVADAAVTAVVSPWLKGNLHTHTSNSSDSGTAPEDVVRWYAQHGYDFVVITDHNQVTAVEGTEKLLVIPGVELTHKTKLCDPPPPDPAQDCRIHVNALFVDGHRGRVHWDATDVVPRVDKYERAFAAARRLHGIAQINHPNWHWGVSGELVAELGRRGALLIEISNAQFGVFDRGKPGKYPSTEELWDAALSEGVTMWGVAVDDAHNYWDVARRRARGLDDGYPAGGAFVMVEAERTVPAIRTAIEKGRFYASTGVLLERAGRAGGDYVVEVAGGFAPYQVSFIGTGGQRLRKVEVDGEHGARFPLAEAPRGYLRAVIEDRYGQRAWTQPVKLR
jgi:hypothetical protein